MTSPSSPGRPLGPSSRRPGRPPVPRGRRPGRRTRRIAATALLAVAGLLAGVVAPLVAGAAAGPISLTDYIGRLDRARVLADAGGAHPSSQAMGAVRQALGLPVTVEIAGEVVPIPRDPILDSLGGSSPSDFLQASDQVAALEDSAKATLATHPPDPERLARALTQAYAGISTRQSLFTRLRHDAWVVILSVWQRIRDVAGNASALLSVVAAVAVVGVVGVLLRRSRTVVPEQGRHTSGRRGRPKAIDWDRLAQEALARGDLDAAVRARYHALLAALSGRGVIPDAPSLTAGECRRAVAAHLPDLYPAVARATSIFESTVYGRAPAGRGEVDTLAETERSVRAA